MYPFEHLSTFNSTRYIRNNRVAISLSPGDKSFNSTRYIRNKVVQRIITPQGTTFNSTRYIRNKGEGRGLNLSLFSFQLHTVH